jgi:hypothetical protein
MENRTHNNQQAEPGNSSDCQHPIDLLSLLYRHHLLLLYAGSVSDKFRQGIPDRHFNFLVRSNPSAIHLPQDKSLDGTCPHVPFYDRHSVSRPAGTDPVNISGAGCVH